MQFPDVISLFVLTMYDTGLYPIQRVYKPVQNMRIGMCYRIKKRKGILFEQNIDSACFNSWLPILGGLTCSIY